MAQRPVFRICDAMPYYRAESVTFQYFGGFAASQQKKCVKSLQDAFRALHPQEKVLEISSRSETELGVQLSAFNPQKSINCQACAAAVYVSLRRNGLVEKALSDPQSFRDIVYGNRNGRPICER